MKRLGFHIILILTVLSSSCMFLAPGWLMVEQAVAIHEMKEKLEREELFEIRLPERSIHWIEQDKECLINQRMFDVKKTRRSGGLVILLGLYDDKEKEIMVRLGKIPSSSPRDQNRANLIYQITHLVLDFNNTDMACTDLSAMPPYPVCPPSPLHKYFTAPPFSPPDLN